MKRSEMIEILVDRLERIRIEGETFDSHYIAFCMLDEVMEAGMLPPSEGVDMVLIEYWDKDEHEEYVRLEEVQKYLMSHTWEPEND